MKKHIRYKKNRYKGTYTHNNVMYLSKLDSIWFTAWIADLEKNPPKPNKALTELFSISSDELYQKLSEANQNLPL